MEQTFDHKKAQQFELDWQRGYIKQEFGKEHEAWLKRKENNEVGLFANHFIEDAGLRDIFHKHSIGKTAVEFGCGSFPQLKEAWNIENRIIIDPLAGDYDEWEKSCFDGLTFFEGLKIYSQNAEIIIPELVNKVDGFILCRNMLDHSDKPFEILDAICEYAARGCYLMLWSDIFHVGGGGVGHGDITKDTNAIPNYLKVKGFDWLCETPKVRVGGEARFFIEFGGVFIKQ